MPEMMKTMLQIDLQSEFHLSRRFSAYVFYFVKVVVLTVWVKQRAYPNKLSKYARKGKKEITPYPGNLLGYRRILF